MHRDFKGLILQRLAFPMKDFGQLDCVEENSIIYKQNEKDRDEFPPNFKTFS